MSAINWKVNLTDWLMTTAVGVAPERLATTVTVNAARCCLNSGWLMFFDESDIVIAAWPTWRVVGVEKQ